MDFWCRYKSISFKKIPNYILQNDQNMHSGFIYFRWINISPWKRSVNKWLCLIFVSYAYATQDTQRRDLKYQIILINKWNSGTQWMASTVPSTKFITLNAQQDWWFHIPYRLSVLPPHCILKGFGCPRPAGSEECAESSCFYSHSRNKRVELQNNKVLLYNIHITQQRMWSESMCHYMNCTLTKVLIQSN